MAQGEEKRHQEGTGILQEMGLWGLTEDQSMAMALSLAPMAGPCIQEMTDMAVLAPMANQEETQTSVETLDQMGVLWMDGMVPTQEMAMAQVQMAGSSMTAEVLQMHLIENQVETGADMDQITDTAMQEMDMVHLVTQTDTPVEADQGAEMIQMAVDLKAHMEMDQIAGDMEMKGGDPLVDCLEGGKALVGQSLTTSQEVQAPRQDHMEVNTILTAADMEDQMMTDMVLHLEGAQAEMDSMDPMVGLAAAKMGQTEADLVPMMLMRKADQLIAMATPLKAKMPPPMDQAKAPMVVDQTHALICTMGEVDRVGRVSRAHLAADLAPGKIF